jgi:hypothetical protein
MATPRQFDRDTDSILSGESYIFKETWELFICRNQIIPFKVDEAQSTFDPAVITKLFQLLVIALA